ncbi:MAG: MMPL family transporter [Chloroflexota bacterium]
METTLPAILFCVLFGLSMDYEVFLLSRMKEASTGPRQPRRGGPRAREERPDVTSAALIVVVVAGSFAFAEVVLIKAVGLVATSVALDAMVVRALLASTMRLLGKWNW